MQRSGLLACGRYTVQGAIHVRAQTGAQVLCIVMHHKCTRKKPGLIIACKLNLRLATRTLVANPYSLLSLLVCSAGGGEEARWRRRRAGASSEPAVVGGASRLKGRGSELHTKRRRRWCRRSCVEGLRNSDISDADPANAYPFGLELYDRSSLIGEYIACGARNQVIRRQQGSDGEAHDLFLCALCSK
eukprot:365826-Chlamydomonas_euryale.AAC.9